MFKFSNKVSGATLLDVLLFLTILGMLLLGIFFALANYTHIFSFAHDLSVTKTSPNIFQTVTVPKLYHEQIIISLEDIQSFETATIEEKIMFPFSSDKKIATEWPKGKSGFLVKSYDGVNIEIIGYDYKTTERVKAGSGYKALLDLQLGNTLHIDQANLNYPYLYVWFDRNQNARVDEGELISLKELDITSIDIASMSVVNQKVNNSMIIRKGSFVRGDGTNGSIMEVDLFQDPFYRVFLVPIKIPDDIKAIPTIQGSGLVRDLQEATAKKSKILATLINYYSVDSPSHRYSVINDLLFYWARSEEVPFFSRLSMSSTTRFKIDLADDLKPSTYQNRQSDMVKTFNNLLVIEQFTAKQQLFLFTKEMLNAATGETELHLAVSFNNDIIARYVAVANTNKTQRIVLISSSMLNFTNAQQIKISQEYDTIKKNIYNKLQKINPDTKIILYHSEKAGYQWIDKNLQNQIKTGEYFVRERKVVDYPRRRHLVECIKPDNIIDQQVRDCAAGKIAKTW